VSDPAQPAAENLSAAQLFKQAEMQFSQLIREELQLAKLELADKGKKAGLGVGLFGTSAVIASFALGALIAAAILGLATTVAAWLAAVIVGAALLLIAVAVALAGKRETSQALPPAPTVTAHEVQADIAAVKEGLHR
jgi:MFS family permease